jgi:hypothetical protein
MVIEKHFRQTNVRVIPYLIPTLKTKFLHDTIHVSQVKKNSLHDTIHASQGKSNFLHVSQVKRNSLRSAKLRVIPFMILFMPAKVRVIFCISAKLREIPCNKQFMSAKLRVIPYMIQFMPAKVRVITYLIKYKKANFSVYSCYKV